MDRVIEQVRAERHRQDEKWGGPPHDDEHSSQDWVAFIVRHLGRAVMWPFNGHQFRQAMIRVAALAVAAVEWHDRGTQIPAAAPTTSTPAADPDSP